MYIVLASFVSVTLKYMFGRHILPVGVLAYITSCCKHSMYISLNYHTHLT